MRILHYGIALAVAGTCLTVVYADQANAQSKNDQINNAVRNIVGRLELVTVNQVGGCSVEEIRRKKNNGLLPCNGGTPLSVTCIQTNSPQSGKVAIALCLKRR